MYISDDFFIADKREKILEGIYLVHKKRLVKCISKKTSKFLYWELTDKTTVDTSEASPEEVYAFLGALKEYRESGGLQAESGVWDFT